MDWNRNRTETETGIGWNSWNRLVETETGKVLTHRFNAFW